MVTSSDVMSKNVGGGGDNKSASPMPRKLRGYGLLIAAMQMSIF